MAEGRKEFLEGQGGPKSRQPEGEGLAKATGMEYFNFLTSVSRKIRIKTQCIEELMKDWEVEKRKRGSQLFKEI